MTNYESKLTVRVANESDLDEIMVIIEAAKEFIHSQGIHQWVNGYPSSDVILDDIKSGRSYVLVDEDNGAIMATSFISFDGESTYDKIYEGNWLTGDDSRDYIAIHRVAISVSSRGRGLSGKIIDFASDFARKKGRQSLRIDTHGDNKVMQKVLESLGFSQRGIIYVAEDNDPRYAYEI